MVLVDTSVWIAHFRSGKNKLVEMLNEGNVLCHPFIIGELACGNIRNRDEILSLLHDLPMVIQVSDNEAIEFIKMRKLMGKGLGYIDVHLLASALLSNVSLWTLDAKLNQMAVNLKLIHK
ncbi:MAG: PIN domain-containing protein [Candidatus Omnitrophica bacterium]|nr:PIN domain-containing protein [Candidatus Omnitrophota bacterium]